VASVLGLGRIRKQFGYKPFGCTQMASSTLVEQVSGSSPLVGSQKMLICR
jgi:hypothetical protein